MKFNLQWALNGNKLPKVVVVWEFHWHNTWFLGMYTFLHVSFIEKIQKNMPKSLKLLMTKCGMSHRNLHYHTCKWTSTSGMTLTDYHVNRSQANYFKSGVTHLMFLSFKNLKGEIWYKIVFTIFYFNIQKCLNNN